MIVLAGDCFQNSFLRRNHQRQRISSDLGRRAVEEVLRGMTAPQLATLPKRWMYFGPGRHDGAKRSMDC